MPFTPPNFPILTPEQVNPFHQALETALNTYGRGVQAAYAPQAQEAEIFNKMIAPLANIAISPLGLAMAPNQQEQIKNMISTMLQRYQGGAGRGGIFGGAGNVMNGGAAAGSSMNTPQMPTFHLGGQQPSANNQDYGSDNKMSPAEVNFISQYGNDAYNRLSDQQKLQLRQGQAPNVLPQSGQGLQGGAFNKATGTYYQTPYEGGKVTQNPQTGETFVPPTGQTVQQIQDVEKAVKNVKPYLDDLSEEGKEFLSKGAWPKLGKSMVSAGLHKIGFNAERFLGTPELAGKYEAFKAKQSETLERLSSSLGLNGNIPALHHLEQILQPQFGDTDTSYPRRIRQEITQLLRTVQQNQQFQLQGFPVNNPQVNNQLQQQQVQNFPNQQGMIRVLDTKSNSYGYVSEDEWKNASKKEKSQYRRVP